MMKRDSIVCCFKYFEGEKPYQKFEVNKTYFVKSITDNVVIISFNEDPRWTNNIAFKFSNNHMFVLGTLNSLPAYEDYFMELKEYRKQKLRNLYGT